MNFVPQDQGGVEMVITTNGLPSGNYSLQLSTATACPAQPSGADLGILAVDPRGNGAVTTYLPNMSANALVGHVIVIGPNLSGANSPPTAAVGCGVIGNS